MSKGNPLTNGTEAQARELYQNIGLCYGCGKPVDRCSCEQDYINQLPDWVREEFKTLDILLGYVPPEPQTLAESISAGEIGDPLSCVDDWAADPLDVRTSEEKLADMVAKTEARYPEAWKYPARSDIGKYKKRTVYWNGDI